MSPNVMWRDAHSMRIVCDPSYEFAMRTPSAGEAAGVEKGLFVRCHSPSQHRVAMGKSAEAANNVGVDLGVFCDFIVAQVACQLEASFLIGENFRMHERQIEELALLLRHLAVEAALESAIGDGAGDRIGLVGPRPFAEHVARKLIENEDERERALWRRLPRCELVIRGRAPERAKARRDLGVESVVLGKPFVRAGGAPEREHLHRRDRRGRRCDGIAGHSRTRPAVMSSYSAGSSRTKALLRGSLK